MPVFTENYNLKKPLPNENYNVQDQNDNMDIIDSELKKLEQMLENIEIPVTSVNGETGDVVLTADDLGAETPAGAQSKVDAHAALTSAHSATSAATANRIMMRDANGRAKVAAPSAADDIARKDTVDAVQTNLNIHANTSATISVSGHVKHAVLTANLDTTWSGTSAPYTKTVSVSGILSTDTPIIDVVMSGTYSTDEARAEAWGYIYRAVTGADSITFYATDKPTVSIPVQVKVVR